MTDITLSSHVLDQHNGKPASNLEVILYKADAETELSKALTNDDGRISEWMPTPSLSPGIYHLTFVTGPWFESQGITTLYPAISICFEINEAGGHYHIPLLLSAFGYTTYRGS